MNDDCCINYMQAGTMSGWWKENQLHAMAGAIDTISYHRTELWNMESWMTTQTLFEAVSGARQGIFGTFLDLLYLL